MNEGTEKPDEPMLDPIDRPRPGAKEQRRPAASLPPELDPELNNPDATPGTGILPDLDDKDPNPTPSG